MLGAAGLSAPAHLHILFLAAAICAVFRGVLRYGEQTCNHFIAFKLLAHIRGKVFMALRTLCPAKLEGKDKGDLISIITADIELLEVFYAHTISPAAIAAIMSALMALFLGALHPLFALLALSAYVTVGWVLPVRIAQTSGTDGIAFRASAGKLSGFLLDSLRGLGESLQYCQGDKRLDQLDEQTAQLNATEACMMRNAAKGSALTNSVVILFDLALLVLGVFLHWQGVLSFEGLVVSVIALMSSFGPVVALASLGSTLQNTLAAGGRVLDLLDEAPQVSEITAGEAPDFTGAACENVSFSYGGENIWDNLNLDVDQGEILGVVGPSGSGKSTLLRLLMRFWDVSGGSVQISGTDVKRIKTSALRELESFVTQDTHLFHASIAANLRIAKADASQAELEHACKMAAIHDFILTLPQGYDTPVGELGDTLSGGERQRLGLARAFLHDAPLLLLDEPTSNLDSLNEAVILSVLREHRGGKTVVLVSHRPSTVAVAQRVFTVEKGRVS